MKMICKEEKSKIAQNAGKDPRIVPSVDPEDEPEVDPTADDGGNSSITPHVLGDDEDYVDTINPNPNGTPDSTDEGIASTAAPNGVKTGDATDMIPWAAGFGTAIMMLGGAVALRRREA